MKAAAVVIILLALTGVFHKKKKETPPPSTGVKLQTPMEAPLVAGFECADPREVVVDDTTKQRIITFAKNQYKKQRVSDEVLEKVAHYIVVFSRANCLEPELAASLIAAESGFDPNAVSKSGAKGLGQLIDSTARGEGITQPFDIVQNLRGSLGYFRKLTVRWQGYPDANDRALASYLQGPRTVENAGGVPSSARQYIDIIMGYRQKMLSY